MTIDGTPAIRAFVEARIEAINRSSDGTTERDRGVLHELNLILSLCNGLEKQSNALSAAYPEANIPI